MLPNTIANEANVTNYLASRFHRHNMVQLPLPDFADHLVLAIPLCTFFKESLINCIADNQIWPKVSSYLESRGFGTVDACGILML